MRFEILSQNSEILLELLEGYNNLNTQKNQIINNFENIPRKLRRRYKKSLKEVDGQLEVYHKNLLSVIENIEKIAKNGRYN